MVNCRRSIKLFLLFIVTTIIGFTWIRSDRDFAVRASLICSGNDGCGAKETYACVQWDGFGNCLACGCVGGGGCIYGSWKETNCSKSCSGDQGDFCGWTKTRPIRAKYWCTTTHCNPPPGCSATAPTNLTFTRLSVSSAKIDWTPGSNGTSQRLYMGANKVEVEGNCPGTGSPACAVIENNLGASQTSYTTANVLVPGTSYYARVVTYQDASCSAGSATGRYLASCNLSPSALTMTTGDSAVISATVYSSSEIQKVDFTSADPSSVSVAPGSDSSYIYQTTATANKAGTTTITGDVYFTGPTLACSGVTTVNAIPPGPWWQVQDSDIQSNGDLNSQVPAGFFFGLAGPGGYPGVPSYSGTTSLTNLTASTLGWLAASTNLDQKVFDYAYFNNQIPGDTVLTTVPSENVDGTFFESGGTLSYGYYWYKYDGSVNNLDLTLTSAANLGSRKVILLVNSADFYINAPINLTDGQGFFMVAVGKTATGNKGNIIIAPTVGGGASPNLEGIYEADSQFKTGVSAIQLRVRGSVAAYNGILLQRDLGAGNANPAEFFEFAPDQIMLFPSKLGFRKINWQEVAP